MVSELYRMLNSDGGTPNGLNYGNINFVGNELINLLLSPVIIIISVSIRLCLLDLLLCLLVVIMELKCLLEHWIWSNL